MESPFEIPDDLSDEEREAIMQEMWDNGEFDEMREQMAEIMEEIGDEDPELVTEAIQKYLSPLDKVIKDKSLKKQEYSNRAINAIKEYKENNDVEF
jgi:hypothetical protein